MGGVKHIPFSRFKSLFADLTEDDARAKGYLKGNYKTEEVFGLLRRSTGLPVVTTVHSDHGVQEAGAGSRRCGRHYQL